MNEEIKLNKGQHRVLCEALRRYMRFHHTKPLTRPWTGLDYATYAKPVIECKPPMMKFDGIYGKRCLGWLKLTDYGAKIVQAWLDLGYTYDDIEGENLPPRIVTISK